MNMKPVRPKTPKKPMGRFRTSIKDPIEVYCRIRPLDDDSEDVCMRAKNEKTIVLFPPDVSQTSRTIKEVHYSFKYVFDDTTTQKQLFDHVCLPLVQDLLLGSNGLLFTYGITSSGKTYTMTGNPQDGGLLPRSLDVIFNSIKDVQAKKFIFKPDRLNGFDVQSTAEAVFEQQKELGIFNKNKNRNKGDTIGDWCSRVRDSTVVEDITPDMMFSVFVSYVEIYNNYIYDLLEDIPIDPKKMKSMNPKSLREDAAHNTYVSGVTENEVKTVEDALELFYKGQLKRRVSHTSLNAESSRSHSVFTIRIVQAPLDPQGAEVLQAKDKVTISQLSLVDLAGSERSVRTKNTGQKLREAGNINASLMALRNCIEILRESQTQTVNKMVPYRESKLTHLFKTFFEGEGKIRMIICVNPRADYYDETIHVMRFAEMTQDVLISRPTPVSTPTTLGFKHGRGNLYREAIRKAKDQGIPVSDILAPTVYSLGPEFPPLVLELEDELGYLNLIDFLVARIARRNACNQDLSRRQEDFRRNLIAVDKENAELKRDNTIMQMDLDARGQQVRTLEQKLCSSEENIDMLQRENDELKRKLEITSAELTDKDRMLSEQKRANERIRTKMDENLAAERNRQKKLHQKKMAEYLATVERRECHKDEKCRQMLELLNDMMQEREDDDIDIFRFINFPGTGTPSVVSSESSAPVTRSKKRSSSEAVEPSFEPRFTKARSATDVIHSSNGPNIQSSSQSRNDNDAVFYKENKPPNMSQGTRGIAVANPRHRRSTSTGDVWIEHKPIGNLELNTVLQPAIKKKKSVSKLEVKDVMNSEKYILQHQEQDSQGEIETHLYKADINPSAGGGAQVIFNDVEKLRQVSPPPTYNLRKRSGDSLPLREVEDRCTVSVECHGLPSKILKKK